MRERGDFGGCWGRGFDGCRWLLRSGRRAVRQRFAGEAVIVVAVEAVWVRRVGVIDRLRILLVGEIDTIEVLDRQGGAGNSDEQCPDGQCRGGHRHGSRCTGSAERGHAEILSERVWRNRHLQRVGCAPCAVAWSSFGMGNGVTGTTGHGRAAYVDTRRADR